MAFRPLIQRRAALPALATAFAAGSLLLPRTTLHADAPPEQQQQHFTRKPIYDDLPPTLPKTPLPPPPPTTTPTPPATAHTTPTPTPTARLSLQIRRARLFLHAHAALAEDTLNATMSTLFAHERSLTSTLASLAPPPESRERLLPGSLYVLVAAMAGSIVSRNRNVLLRASVPVAVGVGAAWAVLPVTTRNVADLAWTFEEKVPVVAENHLRIRGAVVEGWRQAVVRAEATRRWSDEVVREGRERLEGVVRRGW